MNRQKLKTISCIVLSIVFSLSLGLFIYFKVFLPNTVAVEDMLYYPEELYQEYQKEAEKMIESHEYFCQYPSKTTICNKENETILVIQIGGYDKKHGDYITATVKNFGTNEQEATFERSRKSVEEAYENVKNYRKGMCIFTVIFALAFVAFAGYLIIDSIKRNYRKVLTIILDIVIVIIIISVVINFFSL